VTSISFVSCKMLNFLCAYSGSTFFRLRKLEGTTSIVDPQSLLCSGGALVVEWSFVRRGCGHSGGFVFAQGKVVALVVELGARHSEDRVDGTGGEVDLHSFGVHTGHGDAFSLQRILRLSDAGIEIRYHQTKRCFLILVLLLQSLERAPACLVPSECITEHVLALFDVGVAVRR
ncbi:hypothetical protein PENTCL1PPCAC_14162, partial [Pristionchus entomophagus]